MKVKCLRSFRDKETNTLRRKDTEFEVTKARFREINGTDAGILVEELKKENVEVGDQDGN